MAEFKAKTKTKTESKKRIRIGRSDFRSAENPEAVEKVSQGSGFGKGIVKWGKKNLYPHELVAYRQDNPIHGGIINQKITFMSAAGVDISGLDEEVRQATEDATEDIVDDFETFNGFAVRFKKVGENWKPSHVDFESVRYKAEGRLFAISDDWSASKQSAELTNYEEIKDLRCAQLSGGEEGDKENTADTEVLLYCKVKPKQRILKNGRLSLGYYPVPVYIGAIVSILAGIEQDYFAYSESMNGYKGGTLVSLNNGEPDTEEEADEIADGIKGDSTDRDKQGGVTVVFADGSENAATVQSLNGNNLDKRYIASNKEIRSKILIGHSAGSPTLFAVNSETMFGSKEEMETSYTLFSNNYVSKRQKFIAGSLEWAFARLGKQGTVVSFRKYVLALGGSTEDPTTKMAAKKKDPVLQMLSSMGEPRKGANVIKSKTFDQDTTDEDFLAEAQTENFASLSKNQKMIVKLISEGKTFSEVSKALGKGALGLSLEIARLNLNGVLDGWKLSEAEAVKLEVRYSYEVKAGLGALLIPTSRDFCVDLVGLDRLYTRDEIDRLSAALDTDVWRYRGGWYTDPDTGIPKPSCRHEWKQNVVRL